MIVVHALDGTEVNVDEDAVTLVSGPYPLDLAPRTYVHGVDRGVLVTVEDAAALVARLGVDPPLAKFTRPDSTPVWVKRSAVTAIRRPLAMEKQDRVVNAVLIIGDLRQAVREDVKSAASILAEETDEKSQEIPQVNNEVDVLTLMTSEDDRRELSPRRVNAWIEDADLPLISGRTYRFAINVGALRAGALVAPEFREPNWRGRESLEILILLSGSGFSIAPCGTKIILPRRGSTEPAFFDLTPIKSGSVLLRISLFLVPELVLLEEFEVPMDIRAASKAA
jgi:hypothetical protein